MEGDRILYVSITDNTNLITLMNSKPHGACIGKVLIMCLKTCCILMITMFCCERSYCLHGRALIILLHEVVIFNVYMHTS